MTRTVAERAAREQRRLKAQAEARALHPKAKSVEAFFYGADLIVQVILPNEPGRIYAPTEDD